MTIGCHQNCVSTYTSKEKLNTHRKRESSAAESDPSQPPIQQCRSTVQGFSSNIVNIVSSKVVDDVVNAQDALSIGTEAMKEHERQWSECFRNTISKKVKTFADGKKFVSVGTEKVYDTCDFQWCYRNSSKFEGARPKDSSQL